MLLIIKRFFNLNKSFQNEVPANVILLAYYKNIPGLYLKKSTQLIGTLNLFKYIT